MAVSKDHATELGEMMVNYLNAEERLKMAGNALKDMRDDVSHMLEVMQNPVVLDEGGDSLRNSSTEAVFSWPTESDILDRLHAHNEAHSEMVNLRRVLLQMGVDPDKLGSAR